MSLALDVTAVDVTAESPAEKYWQFQQKSAQSMPNTPKSKHLISMMRLRLVARESVMLALGEICLWVYSISLWVYFVRETSKQCARISTCRLKSGMTTS